MNMETRIATVEADASDRRPRNWRRNGALGVAAAAVAFGGYSLLHRGAPAEATAPPPTVSVAAPLVRDVSQWDDYVGRFAPSRTVEIRPRVSGAVTGVHFKDGDIVRAGQLLFTIDQRPFAAALAEARANAASAASTVALARADLGRVNRLAGDEAVSAGEIDAIKARLQAAEAGLAAATARVRSRALDLEFTTVRAPIAGRISDRRIDAGNLVAGGDNGAGTLLTTINALDPIYFSFDGSEALYLKAQRDRQTGGAQPVEIQLQDESGYRWKGRLDFTDNRLDTRSGTIRGRAVLANPDYFLTPGMFGNMRLGHSGTVKAMLVPDAAIQTDQARKTLLVVDAGGTVAAKPVTLGPVIEGLRIIRTGLAAGDRVVIAGTQVAVPGAKVTASPGRIVPEQATATTTEAAPAAAAEATFAR
ncbi:efflux RND transporter periplasmic adaptor subunit [Sphingomonas sp. BIUV-7]|uniref:Efflux RND transporter periplasmic adaptor subunit n=1 Tax=Sphingomonas natans TaxID=3063330 RepID=A0ABT8YEM5_9SPHN|nr:efflux RND transporter periplasmic adaptor subunit [Sphingomonas sp. BIUV-7]MDO6416812.1 efflux RND transporter periplasmic adaptor subunit [Sphingomonas sp. BIUV-7]